MFQLNKIKEYLSGIFKKPEIEYYNTESVNQIIEILSGDVSDKKAVINDYLEYVEHLKDVAYYYSNRPPVTLREESNFTSMHTVVYGIETSIENDYIRESLTRLTELNRYLITLDLDDHRVMPRLSFVRSNNNLRSFFRDDLSDRDKNANEYWIVYNYLRSVCDLINHVMKLKDGVWIISRLKPVFLICGYVINWIEADQLTWTNGVNEINIKSINGKKKEH